MANKVLFHVHGYRRWDLTQFVCLFRSLESTLRYDVTDALNSLPLNKRTLEIGRDLA